MNVPKPLTGPEVDCTDLDGFMLNVERLMASELVALSSHEVIGAALLLWCRAWKQRPAASLPNDDKVIAAFARMPLARFRKLRGEVLRGFVLCSDGRLYHRTLAAEAVRSFGWKQASRRKREADAERLRNWRSGTKREMHDETPHETRFVAEGQDRIGQGIGISDEPDGSSSSPGATEPPAGLSAKSAAPTVPCPYDAIVEAYHKALPGLPHVRLMTDKRKAAMRKLWGWVLSSKRSDGTRRAETAEEALAWLREYFGRAADNDFLTGRSQRSAEHAGWQCDLDFLLSERGMKHVIERTQDAA